MAVKATKAAKTAKALTSSAEETRRLGAKLAKAACPGDVFSLDGALGCGKTLCGGAVERRGRT